ncbi:helix-turn-helix domain-containing protein (plasmid) [Streptomyces sp. NBC_00111]|uniref:helix-turn-helix domain-containing protein n=1 Tax=Streptomyces sp. NBC_00111 TaxID=2975655 RepID=UPI002F90C87F
MFDQHLDAELDAACNEIRELQQALGSAGTNGMQPLEDLLQIQRRLDQLTTPAVGRAKHMGVSWEVISQRLSMNKDTVRKKFTAAVIQRALTRPQKRSTPTQPRPASSAAPPTTPEPPPLPSAASFSLAPEETSAEMLEPSPDTVLSPSPRDFACVLSNLQRASGHSLRELSKMTQLSPSFLCRITSGERFPTWDATASIARACGADPEVLRKVWEDAEIRRSRKSRPETLDSALRYLHHRAGSPTPWSVSLNTAHTLTQEQVTDLLEGKTAGTWDEVLLLIQALDGEPTYFKPLWQRADTQLNAKPEPPAASTAPEADTTSRIEDLITAFGNVLGDTARSRLAPRRPRAAPIPAATTWAGR